MSNSFCRCIIILVPLAHCTHTHLPVKTYYSSPFLQVQFPPGAYVSGNPEVGVGTEEALAVIHSTDIT